MDDPIIPRKWKLSAHGTQNVFVWGERERSVHTLMKAFLWALYLPLFPALTVEVFINDPRYKPDVVAVPDAPDIYSTQTAPLFWGEAGMVGKEKLYTLVRRYPHTHFAIAKWTPNLRPHAAIIRAALEGVERTAPFDLVGFPADSKTRFINIKGEIRITLNDLPHTRFADAKSD